MFKDNRIILKGYRNLSDRLYNIPIVAPPTYPRLYYSRSNHKLVSIVKYSKAKLNPCNSSIDAIKLYFIRLMNMSKNGLSENKYNYKEN